jgi:hypothetical protein
VSRAPTVQQVPQPRFPRAIRTAIAGRCDVAGQHDLSSSPVVVGSLSIDGGASGIDRVLDEFPDVTAVVVANVGSAVGMPVRSLGEQAVRELVDPAPVGQPIVVRDGISVTARASTGPPPVAAAR